MNTFKELRKEKGLTQFALAQQLGIDQTTVSKWELGKALPDTITLIKLAEFFDVSTDFLLSRSNYFFPDRLEENNEQEKKAVIERPPYEITDKQLIDFIKLYEVMTELQKAHILGYVIAYLETNGVNVKTVLGY